VSFRLLSETRATPKK